ncbi:YIP1 family protein [Pseudooceanicola sp. LIPI14-2-Ac024]|uniref:YIP1 family protein n=1 Tax=Pseudooceanicola sp. LIPI14-2-Ac024 TaxID=3344875 RepID=UPI0035D0C269
MTEAPFSTDWLRRMVIDTVVAPRRAAEEWLSIPLGRDVTWTWVALLSVLNGILYSLTLPTEAEMGVTMPGFMQSPIILALAVAGILLLTAWFFATAGRILGGVGTFDTVLQASLWLQSLRFVFQLIVVLLSAVVPGIAGILALVGGIWSIYILVSFLTVVHRFDGPIKAIGVMLMGVIGVAFAMTFLLTLFGLAPSGR